MFCAHLVLDEYMSAILYVDEILCVVRSITWNERRRTVSEKSPLGNDADRA